MCKYFSHLYSAMTYVYTESIIANPLLKSYRNSLIYIFLCLFNLLRKPHKNSTTRKFGIVQPKDSTAFYGGKISIIQFGFAFYFRKLNLPIVGNAKSAIAISLGYIGSASKNTGDLARLAFKYELIQLKIK